MIRGFFVPGNRSLSLVPEKNTFPRVHWMQCVKGPDSLPRLPAPILCREVARDGSRRSTLPSGAMLRAAGWWGPLWYIWEEGVGYRVKDLGVGPTATAWPIFHECLLTDSPFSSRMRVCVSPPQGGFCGWRSPCHLWNTPRWGDREERRWSKKPVSALRTGVTPRARSSAWTPNTPPFQHRLPLGPCFTSPRSSDLVQAHGEAGPADPSCTDL